jgi:hypothetical protein
MFTYLEKILGKPIRYYESLMASKSEKAVITKAEINKVLIELQPVALPAKAYNLDIKEDNYSSLNQLVKIPKNAKGDLLSFKGIFIFGIHTLLLFINEDKARTDKSNYSLLIQKTDELSWEGNGAIQHSEGFNFQSLPIWEEVIHRFLKIHKLIVSLNPKHPWTLYKEVKSNFERPQKQIYVGGYPQWQINDIDFRQLKNLNFLLEYQLKDGDFSIYFFEDCLTNEIVTIAQKG